MTLDLEVYRQCHEHLKETDKRRDQLSALYAVLVGLVFASFDKFDAAQQPIIYLGVGILGIFVLLAVIQYRKWHIVYVRCAQALDTYLRLENHADVDRLSLAKKIAEKRRYRSSPFDRFNPLSSTEAAYFLIISVVAFIPWQLLTTLSGGLITTPSSSPLLAFVLNLIVFQIAIASIAFFVFAATDKRDPFDEWILNSVGLVEAIEASSAGEEAAE